MSLYRQAGDRGWTRPALVAAIVLAAGLLAGFALGRGTAPEDGLAVQLSEVGATVEPAREALGLVSLHYGQGSDAADVQRQGALAQAESAGEVLAASEDDLSALDRDAYRRAVTATERVADLIERGAPLPAVERASERAIDAIAQAAPF